MAGFERFEDIEAWKRARSLTLDLYRLTSEGAWAKDFGLRDQIRRASVSVMSNIAEGFARRGDKEFRRFLSIACGSAAEVKSQLYIALDICYVKQVKFDELYGTVDEVLRMLTGLMRYLDNERPKR